MAELDDLPQATTKQRFATTIPASSRAAPAPANTSRSSTSSVPQGTTTPSSSNQPRAHNEPSGLSAPDHHHATRHAHSASASGGHNGPRSSIDDLFDDIGDVPTTSTWPSRAHGGGSSSAAGETGTGAMRMAKSTSGGPHQLQQALSSSQPVARQPLAKCMGLFLGGPKRERGRNGAVAGAVLCCNHLRCTKCDFKVGIIIPTCTMQLYYLLRGAQ